MHRTVTALKYSKRHSGRVAVYLDHRYAFSVNLTDAAGLSEGLRLDDVRVEQLKRRHDRHTAYCAAVRLLGNRPHSRWEIECKLHAKGFSAAVTAETLERLSRLGYVQDEAFARFFVDTRVRHRQRSIALLRHELRQRGIGTGIIEAVLRDVDEEVLALEAVRSRLRHWVNLEPPLLKKRIFGFLRGRGFGREACLKTWQRANSLFNDQSDSDNDL
jgi:regulatory protein